MALNQNIKIRLGMRKNTNVKSTGYGKYYVAIAKRNGGLTQRGFIDHVAEHVAGVPRPMVAAVINQLSDCIPELVKQGVSVKLDGIGIFYPTIASAGVADPFTYDTSKHVLGVRIRFKPDSTKLDDLTSISFMENKTDLSVEFVWGSMVTRAPGTEGPDDPGATTHGWIDISRWKEMMQP